MGPWPTVLAPGNFLGPSYTQACLVMPGLCLASLAWTPASLACIPSHAFHSRVSEAPRKSVVPKIFAHCQASWWGKPKQRYTSVCRMGCFPEERGCQEDRHSSVCIKSPLSLQCLFPSTLPQLQPRLGVCPFSFLSLALTLSKEVRLSCLEKKCCCAGS